ncbi:MAG: type II 3-dehydroquinate dehydratase [Bacteroidetes bacterium]|nr:type II 3-dehydroquinate dehydratase [Bacteroidota bacterium]MBM3417980.1 type II 3-dehydroquinate dehydratase [Bacteroidota bacterium]
MKILIVNGPNMNLLGKRETQIYGNVSFEEYLSHLKLSFPTVALDYFQSNVEGELINALQQTTANAIVLNAAGYTHTSVALRDCISGIDIPVVEVHMSNIAAREDFRHESLISPVCVGVISGFGLNSYALAIKSFIEK